MPRTERSVRRAISFAVWRPGHADEVLTVLRPPADTELPNVWGLPAGRVRAGEPWEDAVRRAGREKLGVRLDIGRELARGTRERRDYTLEMRLFQATISQGRPSVPQPYPDLTQYVAWRWAQADALKPAAEKGSLCSRLYLQIDRP